MDLVTLHVYAMVGAGALAFLAGGGRDNGSVVPRVVGAFQLLGAGVVASMMHGWLRLPWDHVDGGIGLAACGLWLFALQKAERAPAALACSIGAWCSAVVAGLSFGWLKVGLF